MDMLDDADLAASGVASDGGSDPHAPSVRHLDLLPLPADDGAPRDAEAPAVHDAAPSIHDPHGPHPLPRPQLRDGSTAAAAAPGKRRRRPRVGKRLQLLLIRKYVQYARQFHRLPDRVATEQLLQQGHDEFYYEGGDVGEPRLAYPAFMKLVRNRRSEFSRLRGSQGAGADAGSGDKEQQREIRALIEELDHVRHRLSPPRLSPDYYRLSGAMMSEDELQQRLPDPRTRADPDEALQALADRVDAHMLSVEPESLAMEETDHSVVEGEASTGEGHAAGSAVTANGPDAVVVPRAKLDLMLRVAQETLREHKKLLEDVRAIEQRLAGFYHAANFGMFGLVDCITGDRLVGCDTDQFLMDETKATLVMKKLVEIVGLGKGGLHLDFKRRSSDLYVKASLLLIEHRIVNSADDSTAVCSNCFTDDGITDDGSAFVR